MVVLVKPIKPARLKDDVFQYEMRHALERAGRVVIKDFQATTKTWEHDVTFHVSTSVARASGGMILEIWTEDEIYRYVDQGTRPHLIWAGIYTGKSNKRVLVFPSIFKPKTTPRVISSTAGQSGGDLVHTPYVEHPGTEAREFSKTIGERRRKWFQKEMQAAMVDAAKKSGNAMP